MARTNTGSPGGGGTITGGGAAPQVAVWDAASNIIGYSSFNYYAGIGFGQLAVSQSLLIWLKSNVGSPSDMWMGEGSGNVAAPASAGQNTGVGSRTGAAMTSGADNSFFGYEAGDANTTGFQNTFIGSTSGGLNTGGARGTFVGFASGRVNTADNNTFIGNQVAFNNTTGADNTFVGNESGLNNVSGPRNSFFGFQAGYNAKGPDNVNIGYQAGNGSGAADYNRSVSIGNYAGKDQVSAGGSVFVGYEAGLHATAGQAVILGYQAGKAASNTGISNVFIGFQAGIINTSGANNMFLGALAGLDNTTGSRNVMIGDNAGTDSATGDNNVFLGAETSVSADGWDSSIAIGRAAQVTASNQMQIGSPSYLITDIRWDGILTSLDMHNNALAQGDATEQQTRSGTYTATPTAVTNIGIDGIVMREAVWSRVGNHVVINGEMDVDQDINNVITEFYFDLPVPSTFANTWNLSGSAANGTTNLNARIFANTANNTAFVRFLSEGTTTKTFSYQFSYEVI